MLVRGLSVVETNNKKMMDIIRYAYEHVPYFNHVINEKNIDIYAITTAGELKTIPCFCKSDIIQYGYKNFISDDFLDENNNLIYSSNIRTERTSGTTMERMEIHWDKKNYYKSTYHHWEYRMVNGNIVPMDVMISAANMPVDQTVCIYERNIYINTANLSDECVIELFNIVSDIQPVWIYTFGSVIYVLIRKMIKLGLEFPKSIRYIEVIGEPFLPIYKSFIESKTGLRVFNAYGCTETNGIAYECECGNFHILSNNVIVDIVNYTENSMARTGNVCVTGLYNRVMPFIRYMLSDVATVYEGQPCKCGKQGDYFHLHTTRIPKILYFDNKDICENAFLYFSMDNVFSIISPSQKTVLMCIQFYDICSYLVLIDTRTILQHTSDKIESIIRRLFVCYGLGDVSLSFRFLPLEKKFVNAFLEILP